MADEGLGYTKQNGTHKGKEGEYSNNYISEHKEATLGQAPQCYSPPSQHFQQPSGRISRSARTSSIRRNGNVGSMSAKQRSSLIEKRTKEKRRHVAKKFISALTLHGYAQFHEASGIRKILWAVILTTMVVIISRLTYLSYRSENYYKQRIDFEMEKVYELDFPTVTICSYLPVFTDEMINRFPVNITKQDFKRFYYHVMSNRRNKQNIGNLSESSTFQYPWMQNLYEKGYRSYKDVLELFEKYHERDINSMFVRRVMKGEKCVIENEPCDFESLFKTVYRHKSQSLCKQFNSFKAGEHGLVSTGNDRENGLSMFWDVSGETYFRDTVLNGLLLEIHPYGTPHHIIDHRRAIYLEPGVLTNIDIEQIMTKRLPKPFKPNCEEHERQILVDYPYSKSVCELECFLSEGLEKCGCIPDQFAEYARNFRSCNITEMRCMFEVSSSLHCHECPVQCDENDYKISTSRLGIGNDWVMEAIRAIKGWEKKPQSEMKTYINQNIVGFRIGFLSLEKQVRRYNEAVPWHERISMLGGMMGLLLGFSVITGFEIIFFLFDYLYITIKYQCTQYLSPVLQQKKLRTPSQLRTENGPGKKETETFLE